jgi:hypothetical protein
MRRGADEAQDPRPRSAVSTGVGMAGLAGILVWTILARHWSLDGPGAALASLFACGVPMILWSVLVDKVHRSPTTGIDWAGPPRPLAETLPISLLKIAGLWITWAGMACLYWAGRWYWEGSYVFAMQVFDAFALPLFLLSIPYVVWLDRRLLEPRDGTWHFAVSILGRRADANREAVADYLRCWAIKGFFLAFMVSVLPGNWQVVIAPEVSQIVAGPVALSMWLAHTTFMIDVSFATIGYLLTMKPLDAHIRSANPYAAAWVAALLCYPPFAIIGPGLPIDYFQGSGEWTYWLGGSPLLLALYAVPLAFLHCFYVWATIAFGIRFSNLTHRGILTHGPYRWTKHPASLSKNLFWWVAALPFLAVSGSPVDAVRNTAMLAAVSLIYYWRSKTEERHLMADPAYRDYAAWMERNAPLPRLVRRIRGRGPEPIVAAE